MILINLISNNDILTLILAIGMFLFIFYTLGRISQNYFSFKKSNHFLSIPIGYIFYFISTEIIYLVGLILQFNIDLLGILEVLKNIALFVVIGIFYRYWVFVPKPSLSWTKTIPLTFFLVAVPIIVYFIMDAYVIDFTPDNADLNLVGSINRISQTNEFASNWPQYSSWNDSQIPSILEKYEGQFYFINISTGLLGFGEDITKETISFNMEYLMSSLISIVVILSIASTFVDSERSIISMIISMIISVLLILVLGYIGPYDKIFYSIPVLILIASLLYNYSYQYEGNDKTIVAIILISLTFYSITFWALMLITIIGLFSILITVIKKGQIVRNSIYFLSTLFLVLIISILMLTFDDFQLLTDSVIYLIVILILFAIITFPLYSIAYSQNRREDLSKFEENLNNRLTFIVIVSSIFLLIFSIIMISAFDNDIASISRTFFDAIYEDNLNIAITIYIFTLFVPSILIIVASYLGYKSPLLLSLSYITLIFNPITLPTFTTIFGMIPNIYLIYLPTTLIFGAWLIGLILKVIPQKLRL